MAPNSELLKLGWHLSDEGVDFCKDGVENLSSSAVIQKALDIDLRDIGAPFLDELLKSGFEKIATPCVLQIQKIRNIASPKHETSNNSPVLLKLCVTDGHSYINCLQSDSWKSVNVNTPPGAKICIKTNKVEIKDKFLLLKDGQFNLLGGNVSSMIEKWEISKKFASYQRVNEGSEEGPPPWIPFGKKINYDASRISAGNFRSLDAESKKEGKEDSAFKQQRMANIAEVSRSKEGKKKVFGGGKDLASSENVIDLINSSARSGKIPLNNFDAHKKNQETQNTKFSEKKTYKTTDTYQGKNKTEYKNSSWRYSENLADSDIKGTPNNGAVNKRGVVPNENIVQYAPTPSFHRNGRSVNSFHNSNMSPRFSKIQESKNNWTGNANCASDNVNASFNPQSSAFKTTSNQPKEDSYNGNVYQPNSPSRGKNQKKNENATFFYPSPTIYPGNNIFPREPFQLRGHFNGFEIRGRGVTQYVPLARENYPKWQMAPPHYGQLQPPPQYFPPQ